MINTFLPINKNHSRKLIINSTSHSMVFLSKPTFYFLSIRYTGGKKAAQEVAKAFTKTALPKSPAVTPSLLDLAKAPIKKESSETANVVSFSYENFCNKSGLNRIAKESISRPRGLNASEKIQRSNEILDMVHKKNVTTLQEFCKHFAHLTVEELRNDEVLIHHMKQMFIANPGLMLSRMGAILIEVCYGRRKFAKCTIEELLKGKAKIEAFPGVVGTPSTEQSTVYNGLFSEHMLNSDTPFRDFRHVTIIETPNGGIRIEELSPSARGWAETVKKLTGNTVNDLNIGEHPYDLKNTRDISISKNHMYTYDTEQLYKVEHYLYSLEKHLITCLRNPWLPKPEKEYYLESIAIFDKFKEQKISTEIQIEIWNTFVVKTMPIRPLNCSFPLFYRSTNTPFEADPNLKTDKYPNLRKQSLQTSEVKDSVMTHVGENKNTMGNSAKEATNGVIDVTKTTSTDEVD
jgi:hypothetical protein